ncbi:MAG: type IX secretion system outer membrane channel protein PorV, partial [Saprospiraceae bacterium]
MTQKFSPLIAVFFSLLLLPGIIKAQDPANLLGQSNTITTAVPFVSIIANSQSRATGCVGVVASDLYSQNGLDQNPAMLSRGKKILGFQFLNYAPWLRSLFPDINLYELGYYHSIGNNNALGFSARYFSLGTITFTDNTGNQIGTFKPKEFMFSLKYAHNFSEHFSVGTGFKYIYSDLTGGIVVENNSTKAGIAVAGDLGFDYRRNLVQSDNFNIRWNMGLAFLSIGSKISYTETGAKDFIPQSMKLGTLFTFRWKLLDNNYVASDFSYQADKLLVPTPPIYGDSLYNGQQQIVYGSNPDVNSVEGAIKSFSDAPDGFSEEMHEIIHQFGTETRFVVADQRILAALRAGYFSEHASKGNRKFLTFGLGLGYAGFRIDFSYLVPTEQRNPLENS